jgi:hypothetical protein
VKSLNYRVGDTITYRPFGGGTRTVVVINKHGDINNGRPGFDGDNDEGHYWGYDEQIVKVH